MIKVTRMRARGCVQLPDTFLCGTSAGTGQEIDIHFGANPDVIVITTHNKKLSDNNKERIRILTETKE